MRQQQAAATDADLSFDFASPTAPLFWISVLGMFLELLLIRWVSTEVRIFAYMQNTVLVVCFMGLGVGCWTCSNPVAVRGWLLRLSFLVLLLTVPVTRVTLEKIVLCLRLFEEPSVLSQAFQSS